MLAPERQARILAELDNHQAVRVTDIAGLLGVSEMTVRRDIDVLETAGRLRRIHGGASRLAGLSAVEPGFSSNADKALGAKAAIAAAAWPLIESGMTIGLTGGTTTYRLARELGRRRAELERLTIVTNSLKVAEALHRGPGQEPWKVIVTGGERTPSEALVGPVTCAALRGLNTDLCFMGVHGIDAARGLTTPNLLEAETNAAFVAATGRLAVLADHAKFNVRALAVIAGLDDVDTIITDDGVGAGTRDTFAALVPTFITAGPTRETP
ncbi:DeoR/GlpR family DNA-binding transcription regulator [Specibacter cremeus]|uniref:DeoR/GlpR family DNA-binding transcription regulator n=1 Tax=Specibacter cremeus TaxID=1629051 RepID=UPI000F77DD85|nr:DeoR/GlpR family DNA-binding transcription regulator [Specibacter cremeus]